MFLKSLQELAGQGNPPAEVPAAVEKQAVATPEPPSKKRKVFSTMRSTDELIRSNDGDLSRAVVTRVKASITTLQQQHGPSDSAVLAGAVAVIDYFGKRRGTTDLAESAVSSSKFVKQVYSTKLADTFRKVSTCTMYITIFLLSFRSS
jgi:hypothetical protein